MESNTKLLSEIECRNPRRGQKGCATNEINIVKKLHMMSPNLAHFLVLCPCPQIRNHFRHIKMFRFPIRQRNLYEIGIHKKIILIDTRLMYQSYYESMEEQQEVVFVATSFQSLVNPRHPEYRNKLILLASHIKGCIQLGDVSPRGPARCLRHKHFAVLRACNVAQEEFFLNGRFMWSLQMGSLPSIVEIEIHCVIEEEPMSTGGEFPHFPIHLALTNLLWINIHKRMCFVNMSLSFRFQRGAFNSDHYHPL